MSWTEAAEATVRPEDLHAALALIWVGATAFGASLLLAGYFIFGIWGPIAVVAVTVLMFLIGTRER